MSCPSSEPGAPRARGLRRPLLAAALALLAAACGGEAAPGDDAGGGAGAALGSTPGAAPDPGAAADEPAPPAPPARHREEFLAIARALEAGSNPFVGTAQVALIERQLATPGLGPAERLQGHATLSNELLRLGRVEEAVEHIEEAVALSGQLLLPPEVLLPLHQTQGVVYLRQAEVQNCIEQHDRDCCILPLVRGGQHSLPEPARRARAAFERCLELAPGSLDIRWLLNVLAMALGEHPDGVDPAVLIPAAAFESAADIGRFPDVAGELGVAPFDQCGGAAVEDFDGDGHLDIVTSTFDMAGPLHFFRGGPGLSFEDRSEVSGLADQLGGLNVLSADYDGDDDYDLLVLRGAWLFDDGRIRNSLLRNDGGVFTDVTEALGLAAPAAPTQAACWADFDDDGRLDLYVGNESRLEQRGDGDYPSQLFLQGADGRFADAAPAAGVTNDRYAKGVTVGDYDNDGDLDLYVSNAGPNRLYRNDGVQAAGAAGGAGGLRFEDVGPALGVHEPAGRSFAAWFFDRENDGWLDLFVGAYQSDIGDVAADRLGLPHDGVSPRLYANTGGTFTDVAAEAGLAHPWLPMGANLGDLDHDGFLDLLLATGDPGYQTLVPNVALRNDGTGRFEDVTTSAGLGHLQKGHGVAFADLDHDGDQDLYQQLGGFVPGDRYRNALFRNPGHGHHFLYLRLRGTRCNRMAVGARVTVRMVEDGEERQVHRAAGSLSSFGGSPHRLEIGLGNAERITSLEVRWPSGGATQVFEDVPLDALLEIEEGAEAPRRLPLP